MHKYHKEPKKYTQTFRIGKHKESQKNNKGTKYLWYLPTKQPPKVPQQIPPPQKTNILQNATINI